MDECTDRLLDVQVLKFGTYTLRTGLVSPVYVDFREIFGFPDLLCELAELIFQASREAQYELVCGVPYTALPLATCLSITHRLPLLIRRKEAKGYGTKRIVEGKFVPGQTCLIVEDVVTFGTSILDTARILQQAGLKVTDAVVLLDRAQGGAERLASCGIRVWSVNTLPQILKSLGSRGRLDQDTICKVLDFLAAHQYESDASANGSALPPNEQLGASEKVPRIISAAAMSYGQRTLLPTTAPFATRLLSLMEEKRTNVALAADVLSCAEALALAEELGPEICMFKIHADALGGFDESFHLRLAEIAKRHRFLLFEDRKFADIGSVARRQYEGGIFRISHWADVVTVHAVAGPSALLSLQEACSSTDNGAFIVSEMSCQGSLAVGNYTQAAVEMAKVCRDFVAGFICTSRVTTDPSWVLVTPGVKLQEGGDGQGQQYLTPEEVIGRRGTDVIVVGRGIIDADDRLATAQAYRHAAWQAYEGRVAQI
uniref:Uridine 5'-monophosphate synthase n=1 Tax=Eptatretus burgeri TaxID=7764 RepID=A0A8C4Q0I0_EPTBU